MVTKAKKVDPRLAAAELEYRIWNSLVRSQAVLDLIDQRVQFLRARRRNAKANEYAKSAGDAGKVAIRPYHNLPILAGNIVKILNENENDFSPFDKFDVWVITEEISAVVKNFGKGSPSDLELVRGANPRLMAFVERGFDPEDRLSIEKTISAIQEKISKIKDLLGI